MVFPLGGDFPRSVNSLFTIVKTDRRICRHDNGTDLCDQGHKLKFPGTCFNQPIGTFNSTDPTFQPTFPVCLVDYESSGFNDGVIFSADKKNSSTFISSSDDKNSNYTIAQLSKTIDQIHDIYKLSITKSSNTFIIQTANQILSSYKEQAVPAEVNSFWKMAQFAPGLVPHLPNFYSELYIYDVYSYYVIFKRLVLYMIEQVSARIFSESVDNSFINLISTDYYTTISGSDDICVDDDTPPFITLFQPTASGIELRPRNQIVDFSLTDVVGGVDLSSVYVSVDSTTSGTFSLIEAGDDQTDGEVSITGDPSSFRFTWVPGFLWEYNDLVTVSISGSDLVPQFEGNPFFCGAPKVNTFIGDIPFQVLNYEDFPATISGSGDITSPTISYASPAADTIDNDIFTPVELRIADDLTGVNLASINISVAGKSIVNNGIVTSSETTILGTPLEYTIIYTPTSAFTYGSTISVVVSAEDTSNLGPNVLSESYSFSFIDEGTLIIENFLPAVGTTKNLNSLDIEVDIRDDTFGVNVDQSFFVINGVIVSGTHTPLVSGTHISYHPPNDFNYGEPIKVTVHATNSNILSPVVKEAFYTLYYGCRAIYFNDGFFGFDNNVDVFVRAQNTKLLYKDLSTGYYFTTRTQPSSDLTASIEAVRKDKDLSASIDVIAPEHRYGETVTIEFYVKDFEGHEVGPLIYTYIIEEKPS